MKGKGRSILKEDWKENVHSSDWVQISLASDICVHRKKKSHFLGDLLINAKLGGILSLSSLPFVTNWSGGVQCTGLQQIVSRTASSNSAICAFLACLWEPTGQQWDECLVRLCPIPSSTHGSRRVGQPPHTQQSCSMPPYWPEGWWKKPAQAVPITTSALSSYLLLVGQGRTAYPSKCFLLAAHMLFIKSWKGTFISS